MFTRLLNAKAIRCSKFRMGGLLLLTTIAMFLFPTSRQRIIQPALVSLRGGIPLQPQSSTKTILEVQPNKNTTTHNANYNRWSKQEYNEIGDNNFVAQDAKTRVSSNTIHKMKTSANTESIDTFRMKEHQEWQKNVISRTSTNIDKCMTVSNLTSPALIEAAKENARILIEQHTSVISPQYLDGYMNYCWKIDYQLTFDEPNATGPAFMKGHIGGMSFNKKITEFFYGRNLQQYFEKANKKTQNLSTVCLPNIYLLGFPKSGSTFLWCLLTRMLNKHIKGKQIQVNKEPTYWTTYYHDPVLPSSERLAAEYIPNFLTASDPNITEEMRKKVALIDACPFTVFDWPKFKESEPELANYCLLPSALPELFPQSKYLVVIREPVSMLYSAFWWSVKFPPLDEKKKIFKANPINGPQIFHEKAIERIINFLQCMNSHPTVINSENCTLWGKGEENYANCISNRTHLLSQCVANTTIKKEFLEAVLNRGIYYVHVRKWLQTIPRERIFFTTKEKLSKDTHTVMNDVIKFLGINETSKTQAIKRSCTTNTNSFYKKASLQMKSNTRKLLTKFYEPFNKLLSDLLEDNAYMWSS